jgi:predicted HTH domain antitoxin
MTSDDMMESLIKAFSSGELSMGQAAKMAGQSVWSFMEMLSARKVSVINLSAADLEAEFAGLQSVGGVELAGANANSASTP